VESEVDKVFESYPLRARENLLQLRSVIFSIATEYNLGKVEETLKWGEPSYRTKKGSPIRIAWTSKKPERYAVYFNCQTSLIETFKEVYEGVFNFDSNRAQCKAPTSARMLGIVILVIFQHGISPP